MDIEGYAQTVMLYNEYDGLLSDFEKHIEDASRLLVKKYVSPHMNVLELGARYGSVSIYIDRLLNDAKVQQVSVEPDAKVMSALQKNRHINYCSFNIYNGTISKKELYMSYNGCGWENKTYEHPPNHLECCKINTITLEDLQKKFNIKFNCLVADCEGFLLEFLLENLAFLDQLDVIIYEEDCSANHPINNTYIDYDIVTQILINNNFVMKENIVDNIGLNNKCWTKR